MRLENLTGTRLGRYTVGTLLGRGGMAAVFQADDHVLRRPVALKILYSHFLSDASLVERFRSEAIISARLEHPNIVPIYDVGETDGIVYIAMKLLPGRSLQDELLALPGALPSERVVEIITQVAAALDYAHTRGVVHRDIKPGNVILLDNGSVVLSDFGIAKSLDAPGLTGTGVLVGTPDYMAPEQIDPKQGPLDGRADIYALGVMAYRMLTGARPFAGSTTEVMIAHLSQIAPAASDHNPRLTPAVDTVLSQALAKHPDQRPQGAGLFARALQEAVGQATEFGTATPPVAVRKPGGQTVIPALAAERIAAASAAPPPDPIDLAAARREAAQRRSRPVWPLLVGLAVMIALVLLAGVNGVFDFRDGNSAGLTAQAQTVQTYNRTSTMAVAQAQTTIARSSRPTRSPTTRPSATPTITTPLSATQPISAPLSLSPTQAVAVAPTSIPPPVVPPTKAPVVAPTRPAPPTPIPPTKAPAIPPTKAPVIPTAPPLPPTPTPCAVQLNGGFGLLWRTVPTVAQALGCPLVPEVGGAAALQYFEGGTMFWWSITDQIYLLYGNGTGNWTVYPNPNDPSYDEPREPTVPPSRYEPIRGFGTLWQINSTIRSRMGWATSPEYALSGTNNGNGVLQGFAGGLMFFAPEVGGDVARIWVLTEAGTWTRYRDANR